MSCKRSDTRAATVKHDESLIQAAVVSALSLLGLYVLMIPNGELGKISMAAASRAKAMGLRAGVSDLIVMGQDSKAHFLEIKTATGRLSESQKKFEALCLKKDWPYAVARSVDEAVEIVKKWGLA